MSEVFDGQTYEPDPIHQAAKEACCKFLLGQPLNEHDRDALRMELFVADNESQPPLF